MNAPIILAQLSGSPQTNNPTPPRNLKIEKPQNNQAVSIRLDGNTKLDFSDIASEKLTFVRVGEKLIVLFDNQSTVSIDPMFDSAGNPLPNVSFEVGPDRIVDGTAFANLFPITTDQSVLPAAGAAAGGPAAGANFSNPNAGSLGGSGSRLALLGNEETGGPAFGDVDPGNPQPIFNPIPVGNVDDEGLSEGNIGGPGDAAGSATSITNSLNVDFGTDVVGRQFAFTAAQDGLNGLTSGGQAVSIIITTINGQPAIIGFVGGDSTIAANQVFTITLDNGPINGAYTFTLLRPLDHPIADTEDTITVTVGFTATDGSGDTGTGSFSVAINDDSPEITLGQIQNGTVHEDVLPGSEAEPPGNPESAEGEGGSTQTLIATGSLGIRFGADRFDTNDTQTEGGSRQDGAVVGSANNADLINDGRSVYFTNTTVLVNGAATTLTSHGETVLFKLDESGTKLIGYVAGPVIEIPSEAEDGSSNTIFLGEDRVIFTVTLSDDGNGSYKFTLFDELDHPIANADDDLALQFNFTARDSDRDTIGGNFTVTVNDDTPIFNAQFIQDGKTVNEDALQGAPQNTIPGNPGDSYSEAATQETTVVTGSLGVLWGADNFDTFDIQGVQDGAVGGVTSNAGLTGRALYFTNTTVTVTGGVEQTFATITSQGETILYRLDESGTKLIGYVAGKPIEPSGDIEDGDSNTILLGEDRIIFTVTLSDDGIGSYKFTLLDEIDHPITNAEDDLTLRFNITARDFDKDTVSTSFTVVVNDDAPLFGAKQQESGLVNEDALQPAGNPGNSYADPLEGGPGSEEPAETTTFTGGLGIKWGADNFDTTDTLSGQDGAVTGSTNNAQLTGRALYFTNADVFNNFEGTLTSDGQTVLFKLDESGSKLIGYLAGASEGPEDDKTIFTVTLSDDGAGTYTFTLLGHLDHPTTDAEDDISLFFNVTARDFDGDTVTAGFSVTVNDDALLIGKPEADIVDEDGFPSLNTGIGNPLGDGDAFNTPTTGNGSLKISWGSDDGNTNPNGGFNGTVVNGDRSVVFDPEITAPVGLTANNVQLVYVLSSNGTVLTATAGEGGPAVFRATLSDLNDGSYTFALFRNIDHAADNFEDDILLNFGFVARDSDGDSKSSSFSVTVDDDTPIIVLPLNSTVDEDGPILAPQLGLPGSNPGPVLSNDALLATTQAVNVLGISWGADNGNSVLNGGFSGTVVKGDRSVVFADGMIASLVAMNLSSDGAPLSYALSTDGDTITATAGTPPRTIFTIALSDADIATYDFRLFDNLDHPAGDQENNINITFGFVARDSDGDAVSASFQVSINDDTPVQGNPAGNSVDEEVLGGNVGEQGVGATGSNAAGQANADLPNNPTLPVSGTLNVSWGADDNTLGETAGDTFGRRVNFATSTGNGTLLTEGSVTGAQLGLGTLTSDGVALNYQIVKTFNGVGGSWDGGYQLVAYKAGGSFANVADQVFTVTLDARTTNGTYTFNLLNNLDHPAPTGSALPAAENNINLDFRFRATDADGDTASAATVRIVVDDDALQFGTIVSSTIDEESVPGIGGNAGGGNGDLDPNPGSDVAGPPASREVTGTFGILWGADDANTNVDGGFNGTVVNGDRSLTFASDAKSTLQALGLKSDGVALEYTINATGTLLTATKGEGGATVFTISLSDQNTGSYSFKLFGNLDHQVETAPGTENDTTLTIKVTARDGDGDAANAQFTVTIDDDAPTFTQANVQNGFVDDEGLSGNAGEPSSPASYVGSDQANQNVTASGNLGVSWGADDANVTGADRSLSFRGATTGSTITNGTTVLDSTGAVVKSHGLEVKYFVTTESGVPTLIGYTGSDATNAANQVFKVTLDDTTATGKYNFQLLKPLDHPTANTEDDRTINFNFTAKDADGDTVDGSFSVTVDDDSPIINAANVQNGFIDEERLSGNAGGDSSDMTAPQDDGDLTANGSLGISYGADGPADTVSTGAPTPATYNFNTGNGTLNPDLIVTQGTVNHPSQPGIATGGTSAPIIINATDSKPFSLNTLNLGLFGTPTAGNLNVILTGFNAAGTQIATYTFAVASVGTIVAGTPTAFNATGTPSAGLLLDRLEISVPNGFAGNVMIDNLNVTQNTGAALVVSDGPVTFTDQSVASNNVTITDGNNNPISLANLKSDGQPVLFKLIDAVTLVAYTGSAPTSINDANVVFSAVLNGTGSGSYTFVQKNNLDHPTETAPGTENDLVIRLNYTAKDFDGDKQSGSFTVTIDDDVPVSTGTVIQGTGIAVYESELSTATGDASNGTQAVSGAGDNKNATPNTDDTILTGFLTSLVSVGADAPGTFTVETTNLSSSLTSLTSHGVPLQYTLDGNKLVAKAGNTTIFTFEVNATTGAYTFTLTGPIDHFGSGGATVNLGGNQVAFTSIDQVGEIVTVSEISGNSLAFEGRMPNGDVIIKVTNHSNVAVSWVLDNTDGGTDYPLSIAANKTIFINVGPISTPPNVHFDLDGVGAPSGQTTVNSGHGLVVTSGSGSGSDQVVLDLSSAVTVRDGDGDTVSLNNQLLITVNDDVVTVGAAPAVGVVDEDERIASVGNIATENGNFTFNFGADGVGSLTVNPAVSLAGLGGDGQLRSNGQLVSFGFVGATLVGYVGSLPTAADASNVVFSVDLSSSGSGSYSFILRQALDHSGSPAGTPITMTFAVTATDGDGDVANTSFAVQVDPAGSISSINYSNLPTGVFVNLDSVDHTVDGQLVAKDTATDRTSVNPKIVGIDNVAGIVDAYGGSADDILVSSSEANKLFGNGGADTFVLVQDGTVASGQTRTLDHGDGTSETINVSGRATSTDEVSGGLGYDTIQLERPSAVPGQPGYIYEPSATALSGVERIIGTGGDDVIILPANYTTDGSGVTVNGGEGDDVIVGSNGNELLFGGSGADKISGLDGDDEISGNSGADTIWGGRGKDTIHGDFGDDEITGGEDDDTLFGDNGNDAFIYKVGDGHDTVDGGAGTSDRINVNGNNQNQNVVLSATATGFTVELDGDSNPEITATAVERVVVAVAGGTDSLTVNALGSSDTITVTGTSADFTLNGTSLPETRVLHTGTLAFRVNGGDGNDTIDASALTSSGSPALSVTLDGGKGNDTLTGTNGADVLIGGDDNDTITGGGGDDVMSGGTGNDTFIHNVGDGNDRIDGGTETGSSFPDYDVLVINGNGTAQNFQFGKFGPSPDEITPVANSNDVSITYDNGITSGSVRADEVERVVFNLTAGDTITFGNIENTALATSTVIINSAGADNIFDFTNFVGGQKIVINDSDIVGTGNGDTDLVRLAGKWIDWTITQNGNEYTLQYNGSTIVTTNVENFFFAGNNATIPSTELINVAPVAGDDTNAGDPVIEAGGLNNTTLGDATASGNVLGNDNDGNTLDTEKVVSVTFGATTVAVPSDGSDASITGTYGTLVIHANGTYTYTLNDADPDTNKLPVGAPAADTFTYVMQDHAGLEDTADLKINITGANDNPVAQNDVITGGGGIRVAVIGSTTSDVNGAVAQLNDDTYFNFTATGLTLTSYADKAAWNAALAGYDVVVVGHSGVFAELYSNPEVFAALKDFADAGHGIVSAGWYSAMLESGTFGNQAGNADYISPVRDGTAPYDFVLEGQTFAINSSHPITNGVSSFTVPNVSGNTYWERAGSIDAGATVLASFGGNATIAYSTLASGAQLAYLGGTYLASLTYYNLTYLRSGDADRLLEQAVNWSANGASAAITEDATFTIQAATLLANDSDVDTGDVLTIQSVSALSAKGAAVTLNPDGSISYNPAAASQIQALAEGATTTDTFTYTVSDGHGGTSTATVTLTVTGKNDAPVANPDVVTIAEDSGQLQFNVLANDTDIDGTPKINGIQLNTPGAGTVQYLGDTTIGFTPAQDFFGTAVIEYRIVDEFGAMSTSYLTVTVTPVNDRPVSESDGNIVNENESVSATAAAGLLANDSDVDDAQSTLAVYGVATTANGITAGSGLGTSIEGTYGHLTVNADGSYTYVADKADSRAAGVQTADTFLYITKDPSGALSNANTLNITVVGKNDAPVANNDSYSVNEDNTLSALLSVLNNDTDVDNGATKTAVLVSGPAHGSLVLNTDGTFTYTPDANYFGSDFFTYKANDGLADSNVATVNLTINPVNDAPVANNDSYTVIEDTPLTLNVRTNDTDVDGPSMTPVLVAGPVHGTVVLSGGLFIYTPNANYNGTDSFSYKVNDGSLDSNIATVSLNILPVNDSPVAVNDTYATNEDTALNIVAPGVLGNDSDIDGDPLAVTATNVAPAHGTLTLNANGSFTYTPAANYNGTDSFTYTVSDGNGGTTTATATITVNPVNDNPNVPTDTNNAANAVAENSANGTLVGITANATDIDGDTVTYSLTNNAGGRFAIDSNSGVVSVLNGTLLDYETNTSHSITVQASDGHGGTSTQTFTINVTDVNEVVAPTPVSDPTSAGHYAFLNDNMTPNAISFDATTLFQGSGLTYTVTEVLNTGSQNWSWFHSNNSTTFSGNPNAASHPGLYVVEVDAKSAAGGATTFTAFSVLDGNGSSYEVTNNNASGAGGRAVTDDWRNNLVTLKAGVNITGDVSGGSNNDVVVGNEFDNRLFGSDGNDAIYGEGGNDYIDGGSNTDFLSGGAGNDTLIGLDGDDYLLGGSGNDTIDGGSNKDTIVGGTGNDTLTGGSDTDRFVFSESGAANRDDILDFVTGTGNSADIIDISALLDQYSTGKSDHVRFLYSDANATTRLLSAAGNAPAIDGDVTIQVNTTGNTWESVATIKDTGANLTTSNNVIQMMLDHATTQQFNA